MQRPIEGLLASQKLVFYFLFTLKFPFMSDATPKAFVYLWEFFSWFSVILPLHMTICIFYTVYARFALDDLLTLTITGIEGAWFFFSFLGMTHYKLRSKDFATLIDNIEETFKWRSARGKTFIDMRRVHKVAKVISLVWQTAPGSSVLVSLVTPLLEHPVRLPVPTWYFVDQNNIFQFTVGYLLQAWAKLIMVCSFASGSSFFISFSLLCCGQFNILRCNYKNLIYTSGVYKRFPKTLAQPLGDEEMAGEYTLDEEKDDAPLSFDSTQESSSLKLSRAEVHSFQAALKDCVLHHLAIRRLCATMEDIFNKFAFLRVAEMTLQICFLAFVYVRLSMTILLVFMLFTFVDLFLLTYPAEHIQWNNSNVGSSLMLGPWYLVSEYFRNDFNIIMAYSMIPLNFTAGKILKLDFERFRVVSTTAFSYYTLMSSFEP